MRVAVAKTVSILCGTDEQVAAVSFEANAELTDDDLDLDPEDRRDPVDAGLQRAFEAVNDALSTELEALQERDVAISPTILTKIIATL